MITSKHILEFFEEYLWAKRFPTGYATVFVNPSSSDLVDLLKTKDRSSSLSIRFVADARSSSGKVYIWDFSKALHYEIRRELGLPYDYFENSKVLNGQADFVGGKLVFSDKEETFLPSALRMSKKRDGQDYRDYLKNLSSSDYSWLDYYVKGTTTYIDKVKTEFNSIKT
jgi:hypothetical protein